MKQKKQKEKKARLENPVHTLPAEGRQTIYSDVNGSYTGTPADGGTPVQDADDL